MLLSRNHLLMVTLALSYSICTHAQSAAQLQPVAVQGYQQAPQPIHDILAAAPTPRVIVGPGSEYLLCAKNAYLSAPEWSPDGKRFVFTNASSEGTELWLGDVESASAAQVLGFKINSVLGEPVQWMPDGLSLLIQTVPASRGNPPEEVKIPNGPIIQESDGKKAPVRTYENLLTNPHDEVLFDYYATAQLQVIPLS